MEKELEYWRVQLQGLPALQALRLLSHTISDYYPILSQLTSYSISPYFHLAFADFAGHLSSLEMSRRTAGAYRLCAASNTTLGWWSGATPPKKETDVPWRFIATEFQWFQWVGIFAVYLNISAVPLTNMTDY